MPHRTLQQGMMRTRALIKPGSFDDKTRSFDVTFVTETPVPSYDWDLGQFNEILSCNPDDVRLSRASNGLPFFDNHYPRNTMSQLGRCSNFRFENGEGLCTVTLGARADEALVSDIKNGIVSGVSVGYNVYKYQQVGEITPGSNEKPTLRATDWEPLEVSSAPVQADLNSRIRGQQDDGLHTVEINYSQSKQRSNMSKIAEIRAKATNEQKTRLDAILELTRSASLADDVVVSLFESTMPLDMMRTMFPQTPATPPATPPTPPANPNPVPAPEGVEAARAAATKAEKDRIDAIMVSVRAAKLPDAFGIELIQGGKDISECRQLIINKFVEGDRQIDGNNGANVNVKGKDPIDKKREACEDAILHRVLPNAFPFTEKSAPGARDFAGYSIHDIANMLISERSGKVQIRSKLQLAEMIYNERSMSSTDFPLLLENVMGKALRADYEYAPEFWEQISKKTTVSDFREKTMYQVESVNGMSEIAEGDEIKYGKLKEGKQTIKVKSFAQGLMFTRQMFINDDLSAFSKIPDKFVLDWNTTRGDLVWSLVINNPNMADGKAFFDANTHKNLITNAFGLSGMKAAILAFKNQTGIDGKRKIRVLPTTIIVSPELEADAKALLTTITPNVVTGVNIYAGQYNLIVEPRLSGNAWYLIANPNSIDGIYHAYLDGNEGLRSNREDDFNTDSMKFAVRSEFGTGLIDYRGWLKSTGAGA